MNPIVTVIIPTYNRADLLPQAVKSVLSQTFTDFELLILDDSSTDNTHEVIKPFLNDSRVRYIYDPENKGITANRNYGLGVSKGIYIAMLDSDDVWINDSKLQRQVEILDAHPEVGVVGTFSKKINAQGEVIGEITAKLAHSSIRRNMMFRNQLTQSSVLIRKEALDNVGWYDENIPIWEDYELWLRIGLNYQLRNIPEFFTGYRVHEGNISNLSKEKSISAYTTIYQLYKKKYPFSSVLLGKILVKKFLLRL
jgi:glycosyltransferase involved in cell wall biosynthesis